MSDRYGSYPPDEPIIGGPTPPPPPPGAGSAVGYEPVVGDPADYDEEAAEWDDEAYDDEGYADDYDEYEYADDEYYDEYDDYYIDDEPATRQPLFYVFIAAAVLVGVAAIFLLFAFVRGGNGDAGPTTDFRVSIESPRNGDRIEVGAEAVITVSAAATEEIARFELFVDGEAVTGVDATPPATGDIYHATMKTVFNEKGEHELWVRVISVSGASKDSDKVRVVVVEDIGDRPVRIKGRVLASVTMRTGPGDDYESAGTLQPGREVDVIGRTRNGEWLLIDVGGGNWVPRSAIELLDSIELVPIREPTPTPVPTPTPEPSPTPTPEPQLPDFAPTDAFLVGNNLLRVTIANRSSASYEGVLVVSATGVGADPPSIAVNVSLPGHSSITVDFTLSPGITEETTVNVKVDPDNAIEETVEDNNSVTFVLQPPADQPTPTPTDEPDDETPTPTEEALAPGLEPRRRAA